MSPKISSNQCFCGIAKWHESTWIVHACKIFYRTIGECFTTHNKDFAILMAAVGFIREHRQISLLILCEFKGNNPFLTDVPFT